jgi:transcriptional regulator with XRE-family HTH domain
MARQYRSVTDMIAGETSDQELVSELQQEIEDTRLAKTLIIMRTAAGITQAEMAKKLGRTQGSVSKLEHARNDSIKVSDLMAYADALDLVLSISFQEEKNAVESVKYHAFQIQKHLDHLAKLAHRDDDILEGVKRFFSETLYNVLRLIGESVEKLPRSDRHRGSVLEVTSPGETELQHDTWRVSR